MYRLSYLRSRTGYHDANPSHTKSYSDTYPRKGKTQQVEGLTTRPPRSTAPPQHLKDWYTRYHEKPTPTKGTGHITTSESPLTNHNYNCANTMAHNNR
ncbi:hypothetical protein Taro_026897 [Colocasia esculenta]|uniref:Uncharacterized protein n=1 Tax=Colocasia esculenta TaxID=4460 RepID=A0A843VM10_COLES|nr:hypothetical protein [Colocasia esculenta]